MSIIINAPAKINLCLAIGPTLPNGLHQLSSVMQAIDLSDELIFSRAEVLIVECSEAGLSGSANLAYKAARRLQEVGSVKDGVRIRVNKHIPIAAGLGGGSSDAATVLRTLNNYWQLSLSENKLSEIAAELGADIPFFLRQGTQLAEGYGQKLSGLTSENLEKAIFVLANPGKKLSAEDVYNYFDAHPPHSSIISIEKFLIALAHGDIKEIAKSCFNQLEAAATELCPEILLIRKIAIENGALAALVSGSGPTVVAVTDSYKAARKIADALSKIAPFVMISAPLLN